jgi:peptidoglycan glycosyltransferase
MDRQIRRLGFVLVVLFAILFAQLNWIQVFGASRLRNNPANFRLLIEEYNVDRGEILGKDLRTVLARSFPTKGRLKFLRRYPQGPEYADITGYYSLVYGRSGLEQTYNDFLGAHAGELFGSTLEDDILNRPRRGATVVTTIDPTIQSAAVAALNGRPGAVAALDPRTGAVLALASNPAFDPNALSSHDPKAIKAAWKQLNADPQKPLLSNATEQIYAPGSTFKLIDTAAALESGMTPQTTFSNPATLNLPQTTHNLQNFGGEHCLGGAPTITLAQALTVSCDVTFAELGLRLGADRLAAQAEKFGFNSDIPFDVPFHTGRFPNPSVFEGALPNLAFSAIGQYDVAANPLQMALVAAAIANGGVEMRPQLVKQIRDPDGGLISSFHPEAWGRPISPETAATMTQMMESVVQEGTGTPAQIPGVAIAGKTGTAQVPGAPPHVWFVAFAPAENPQIAVAVVLLEGGGVGSEATGGVVAGPVAKQVIEAALGRAG